MQILEVTRFGVRSAVIRLRHRTMPLQFVIYPMIHMASLSFYADVTARLATADVIVAEGVRRTTRRSPLIAALTLSYRILKFNRRVDLVEQDIDFAAFTASGIPVINPDVDADEFRSSWRRAPWTHRLMMWCVLPVVILGRLFGGSAAIWSTAMQVDDLPTDEEEDWALDAPELEEAICGERDRRLIAALRQLHEQRGSENIEVAVVYGAGHVGAIVHALCSPDGYLVRSGEWLTVVDLVGDPALAYRLDPQRSITRAKAAVRARETAREAADLLSRESRAK
ncbi:MAG TPA: hypothetical protein VFT95_05825 [Micromonosporaceae bacterium]|nr:hypothetical protein [Micromonosporaceae bacterium]